MKDGEILHPKVLEYFTGTSSESLTPENFTSICDLLEQPEKNYFFYILENLSKKIKTDSNISEENISNENIETVINTFPEAEKNLINALKDFSSTFFTEDNLKKLTIIDKNKLQQEIKNIITNSKNTTLTTSLTNFYSSLNKLKNQHQSFLVFFSNKLDIIYNEFGKSLLPLLHKHVANNEEFQKIIKSSKKEYEIEDELSKLAADKSVIKSNFEKIINEFTTQLSNKYPALKAPLNDTNTNTDADAHAEMRNYLISKLINKFLETNNLFNELTLQQEIDISKEPYASNMPTYISEGFSDYIKNKCVHKFQTLSEDSKVNLVNFIVKTSVKTLEDGTLNDSDALNLAVTNLNHTLKQYDDFLKFLNNLQNKNENKSGDEKDIDDLLISLKADLENARLSQEQKDVQKNNVISFIKDLQAKPDFLNLHRSKNKADQYNAIEENIKAQLTYINNNNNQNLNVNSSNSNNSNNSNTTNNSSNNSSNNNNQNLKVNSDSSSNANSNNDKNENLNNIQNNNGNDNITEISSGSSDSSDPRIKLLNENKELKNQQNEIIKSYFTNPNLNDLKTNDLYLYRVLFELLIRSFSKDHKWGAYFRDTLEFLDTNYAKKPNDWKEIKKELNRLNESLKNNNTDKSKFELYEKNEINIQKNLHAISLIKNNINPDLFKNCELRLPNGIDYISLEPEENAVHTRLCHSAMTNIIQLVPGTIHPLPISSGKNTYNSGVKLNVNNNILSFYPRDSRWAKFIPFKKKPPLDQTIIVQIATMILNYKSDALIQVFSVAEGPYQLKHLAAMVAWNEMVGTPLFDISKFCPNYSREHDEELKREVLKAKILITPGIKYILEENNIDLKQYSSKTPSIDEPDDDKNETIPSSLNSLTN